MHSLLKNVFVLLGITLISLMLYNITFGIRGRTVMWSGIKPVVEKTWKEQTLNDGKTIEEALTNEFNSVNDLSN